MGLGPTDHTLASTNQEINLASVLKMNPSITFSQPSLNIEEDPEEYEAHLEKLMNSPTNFDNVNIDEFKATVLPFVMHKSLSSAILPTFSQPLSVHSKLVPAPEPVVMSTWRQKLIDREPKKLQASPITNNSQAIQRVVLPSTSMLYNSVSQRTLPKYESTKPTSKHSSKSNLESVGPRKNLQKMLNVSQSTHDLYHTNRFIQENSYKADAPRR